ncbi:sugar ABC transporter permease [Mycoplasmatota bacterium WC44]
MTALNKFFKFVLDSLKRLGNFVYNSLKNFFVYLFMIPVRIYRYIRYVYADVKENPKAFRVALRSFFIMGLGQFKNKQKYKGVPFLVIGLLFLIVEIASSSYWFAPGELFGSYPIIEGEKFYFFRDYGGFFTSSLWGFFTLGRLVIGDTYRGEAIKLFDKVITWKSADNSIVLLGEGILALILIIALIIIWVLQIRDAYETAKEIKKTKEVETFQEFKKRMFDDFFAYIIIIPAAVLILFITLVPFLFSFLIAFTNFTSKINIGGTLIKWVGFSNFGTYLFQREGLDFFFKVFTWTVVYAVMASITVYLIGFIQALIVESKYVKHKKIWRIFMILPWAIPAMISLMMFKNVFSDNGGLANELLINFGVLDQAKAFLASIGLLGQTHEGVILWYSDPLNGPLAKAIILLVNMWLGSPYFMLLIVGVLGTIPATLYEAAEIDGASATQKFRFITFPWVLRATIPVIITTFTFNFNNFGAIYFLTGGGPGFPIDQIPEKMRVTGATPGQSDILISWIYKIAFSNDPERYNLASVYSILIFLVVGLFAIYNLSKVKSFWED